MEKHYIEFENVVKTYGSGEGTIHALSGIDFGVNKGEFCVLLGSSGAGKTTLLNMLGGMDTITSGKITFDGREISKLKKKELVNNWTWFWISMITFIISVMYLSA